MKLLFVTDCNTFQWCILSVSIYKVDTPYDCGNRSSRVVLRAQWMVWSHSRHPAMLTGHQTGHLPFRSLPDLFPFCYANPSSRGNYTTRIKSIPVFTRWVRVECESSVSAHKSGKTALFPCKHLLAAVWIILILYFAFFDLLLFCCVIKNLHWHSRNFRFFLLLWSKTAWWSRYSCRNILFIVQ